MSLNTAEKLLRQYNKDNFYTKNKSINTQSDTVNNKIGTWSYANMYDALYAKFSKYKNFDINMWRDAIRIGEQDQYLAFLEQNKDNTLSEQFYDPQYYDYETMMLEMYLPFADNTNREMRTTEIYNNLTNEWIEEELGEMSDREYIQYQLNNARQMKQEEITLALETARKEELSWFSKFGHSALATGAELGEGVLSGLTGILDFFGGLGYASYQGIAGGENWLDAYVDYFGDKGLTALEKENLRTALDEYERTHTFFRDIDGSITGWGTYLGGVANSIGMMVPAIIASVATSGAANLSWVGTATFYTSMFSNSMYDVANNTYVKDSPSLLKIGNVAVKTAVEAIIEYGLDKVLGGTIQNRLLGIGGKVGVAKNITRWTGLAYLGKSAAQEGLEEFLQDFSTNLVDQFTDMIYEGYGNTGVTAQTLVDAFLCGVLSSIFLSGGTIAASAMKSGVINARAKKKGTYNTELGYGPGDVVIESEKGVQKLRGANKLYFGSILSDFREAVKDLKNSKFNIKKNLGLAQEVYDGLSAISQFYSSFSEERIKACEMLLDRVAKAEHSIRGNVKENVRDASRGFGTIVEATFAEMVGDIGSRKAKQKVHDAVEKHKDEFEDGKVKEVKSIIGKDGTDYSENIEKVLTPSAKTRLDELMEDKDYKYVFLTDGHIAIEEDKMLFVPVSWLEHFETNAIYQFLKQSEILEVLSSDKDLSSLWKDVTSTYREFSGRKDATDTEALMQFLFNESVYQKVLLSNDGKNAHQFNKYIFQMYDTIKRWADASEYTKHKGKEAKNRVNALNLMLKRIKKAHRIPALKAILNWGFELDEIKAWDILIDKDYELIDQYKKHKETLSQPLTGKMTSAYEHLVNDIIKAANFNDEELDIIKRVREGKGTQREQIIAYALLNFADDSTTAYTIDPMTRDLKEFYNTVFSPDVSVRTSADLFVDILSDLAGKYSIENWPKSYLEKLQNIADKIVAFNENGTATDVDYGRLILEARELVNRAYNIRYNTIENKIQKNYYGTFTIPVEAFGLEENNADRVQFIADKLTEFEKRYGISAKQMILSDLTGMSIEQRNTLTQDMELVGVNDIVTFVSKKLELLLGEQFSVIPTPYDWTGRSLSKTHKSIRRQILKIDTEYLQRDKQERISIMKVRDIVNQIVRDLHYYAQELKNSQLLAIEQNLRDASTITDQIDILVDTLLPLFEELPEEFSGFVIADKISADKLLTSELISDVDREEFNDIFTYHFAEHEKEVNEKPGIDMSTGEVVNEELYDEYRKTIRVSILDFLSAKLPEDLRRRLKDWTVALREPDGEFQNYEGVTATDERVIYINPNARDIRKTFVHEVNHAIQYEYNLPGGFNTELAEQMPALLKYVWENYTPYVAYVYRQVHGEILTDETLKFLGEFETDDDLYDLDDDLDKDYPFAIDVNKLPKSVKKILAYCAYTMVQGEMFAAHFPHNENVPKSFTVRILPAIGGQQSYILSPDGKEKFFMDFTPSASLAETLPIQKNSNASPALAENALYVTMRRVMEARALDLPGSENPYVRNTYHTRLTKNGNDIINSLIDKSKAKWLVRTPTIDELIREPSLLSEDVLEYIGDDLSEGAVASAIRMYLEDNFDGVSLDRTGNTHRYVFVDDNSYDDLLLNSMLDASYDNENTSLYEKYKNTEGIPLSTFYKSSELKRLGITSDVKVVINPYVKTEAVFERGTEQGIIYITADDNTTNAKLIDKLNHEFRHIMQRYNVLETGFTPDFKVTQELIADVKKHVPELFKDKDIKTWALIDAKNKKQSWEASIVQRFVYGLTGGELQAYGIDASLITSKTIYVTYEAGKPTIFMPWYDTKTGEGRHRTDYIAARADDTDKPAAPTKLSELPGISLRDMSQPAKRKKTPQQRVKITKKRAGDTNLKYFVEYRNQLDEPLADFIEATTGHEDELPPALWNAIEKGALTRTAFEQWFREAEDINEFTFDLINKYIYKNDHISSMEQVDSFMNNIQYYRGLFSLIVKHGAHLSSLLVEHDFDEFLSIVENMKELYIATREIEIEDEHNKKQKELVETVDTFANLARGDAYRFTNFVGDKYADKYQGDIDYSQKDLQIVRNLVMEFFDGTPAGAFFVANATRQYLYNIYVEGLKRSRSGDATVKGKKGDDKDQTEWDLFNEDDANKDARGGIGNDILGLYNKTIEERETKDYIIRKYRFYLIRRSLNEMKLSEDARKDAYKRIVNIEKTRERFAELEMKMADNTITDKERAIYKWYKKFLELEENVSVRVKEFAKSLNTIPMFSINEKYTLLRMSEITGKLDERVFDLSLVPSRQVSTDAEVELNVHDLSTKRERIVSRVQGTAKNIINRINTKEIKLTDLPENIREMFEYVQVVEEKSKRKITQLRLKQEIYTVGRGRARLPGETEKWHYGYSAKRDIDATDDAYKHDTSHLLDIEILLKQEIQRLDAIRKANAEAKRAADKAAKEKSAELRKRAREAEAEAKEAKEALKAAKKENKELSVKTDFVIRTSKKKKSGISDAENHFTVMSGIEMPEVLVDLLDVSFNRTAETLVQFASKDENGNLFYKERNEKGKLRPIKDFESAMRHEVANWDIYYEAVRDKLQNMTRSDALNIVDFIEHGAIIFGTNANKLQAIQIYLVGYIIDCAEKNSLNWNFSDAEKAHLRAVWENMASIGGTILSSVKQMLEVIDPFEKVKQRMFDDWISVSDGDKDDLFKAVESMQNETNVETRNKKAENILKTIEEWQEREFEMRNKKEHRPKRWSKEWFAHWWHKATSLRYLAMLSGPTTWIRNQVSNAMNLGLNTMADLTAKAVFVKRGYREDLNQWDLSGVKVSPEVKAFIDAEVKSNPLFKSLYNMSGKYDDRPGTNYKRQNKQLQAQKELFVSIITKRFEQKYAAEHRFDSKAMNAVAHVVNWLMSDGAFVKFVSNRYFGKILTIEVERGNVSLDNGLSNDVLNLFAEAVIQGNQEYMHKRSYISNMLDGLREKNAVAYEAITLFMPFMNSSWNWFTEILKYNPVALIGSIIKLNNLEQRVNKIDSIRNDPKKRDLVVDSRFTQYLLRRDVGKGIFGTLLLFLGLFLGLAQVLRFDEEDEKIYVYVRDAKVDISNIFGTSSVLIGATVAQKWIEQSNGETMSFEDRLTYVTEYFMQGLFLNDILERHSWNKTALDKLITETDSVLRSWNPQIIQLIIASTNNDKIRYSSGIKGAIERYLNSWIPTQPLGNRVVNPYTGEIESKYALPIIGEALKKGVIFGAKVYWYEVDEAERLCRELGVNKNELTGELTITLKDGTKKEYSLDREKLNVYYGELNKADLAKIKSQKHTVEMPDGKFKTLSWDQMSDEQRARVINKVMRNNAEIAKIYIWTQVMKRKYYASNSLWSELRKLGITQNVYKGDRDFVE